MSCVPLSPIEVEVLDLIARAEAVSWETLIGRFDGRCDRMDLDSVITSFQRNKLVTVLRTGRGFVISITPAGTRAAEQARP